MKAYCLPVHNICIYPMHAVSKQITALMKEIAELKSAITSSDGVVGTLTKKISDLQNQVEKQTETTTVSKNFG